MKYLIGLVLFVFSGTAGAQAAHVVPSGTRDKFYLKSGNDLLRMCQADLGDPNRSNCIAYIDGVVDLIGALQANISSADRKSMWKFTAICLPIEADAGQIRDVVVKYLVENPAERNRSAAAIIIPVLIQAWRCPAR